jgi:hypothetical protein
MQPGREFEAGRILRPCRLRKVTRHSRPPIDGFSIGLSRNRRWDQEWVASGPDTCAGANGDAWDTLGCRREFARPVVVVSKASRSKNCHFRLQLGMGSSSMSLASIVTVLLARPSGSSLQLGRGSSPVARASHELTISACPARL